MSPKPVRPLAALAGVLFLVVEGLLLARVVGHALRTGYQLSTLALMAAGLASALWLIGIVGLLVGRHPGVALGYTLVVLLLLYGILGFGLGLWLASGGVALLIGRVLHDRGVSPPFSAFASGGAIALGLVVLFLAASAPPLIGCRRGGGTDSNASVFRAVVQSDGTEVGTVLSGGHTYRFACRDGQLIEFRAQ